jgi:hypothetical protein
VSKQLKANLIKYAVTSGVGLVLVCWYVIPRLEPEQDLAMLYRILCDGFFLPGIFMIFIGLMFVMNNLGALDTISFAFHYLAHTFLPVAFGEGQSYLEYVEGRREKRTKGFGCLFVVGLEFIAIATVFLILFYSVFEV